MILEKLIVKKPVITPGLTHRYADDFARSLVRTNKELCHLTMVTYAARDHYFDSTRWGRLSLRHNSIWYEPFPGPLILHAITSLVLDASHEYDCKVFKQDSRNEEPVTQEIRLSKGAILDMELYKRDRYRKTWDLPSLREDQHYAQSDGCSAVSQLGYLQRFPRVYGALQGDIHVWSQCGCHPDHQ